MVVAANTQEEASETNALGIAQVLSLLRDEGEVAEIRILDAGKERTVSGYFNDWQAVEKQVAVYDGHVPGIYFTINPVRPDLLARGVNRLVSYAKTTTNDDDIVSRKWFPIDIDPSRPSGVSSTDQEHLEARDKARAVSTALSALGWPEPILADSGNGAHLLYRVELPNDKETLDLCKAVLQSLSVQFDDELSCIDVTVCNAARIWKLYGTTVRKGDPTSNRPHRISQIISMPNQIQIVSRDLLQNLALATEFDQQTSEGDSRNRGQSFDLEPWLAKHGLTVIKKGVWKNGYRFVLEKCPFNETHTGGCAVVVKFSSGALAFRCHHNSCNERKWKDLRLLIDPNFEEQHTAYNSTSVHSDWPALELPSDKLKPVDPFNEKLLPTAFRDYILDVADRLQCPPDFTAAAAITFAGGVLGKRVGIRPKRQDDWLVVPNLWGAAVGRPGVMKTPAIAQAQKFLARLEVEARTVHQKKEKETLFRKEMTELKKQTMRTMVKDKLKKGAEDEAEILMQNLPQTESDPIRERFIVNDVTVEKLGEILSENPYGITLVRDELVGFLRGLDKAGNETQRAFMLEAWTGTGSFVYDRIMRGTIDIEASCVSVFGGIQPGPFSDYLRGAIDAGIGDDGLVQRFQMLVWPDVSEDWKNVDRWPDTAAKERMWCAFKQLSCANGAMGEHDKFDSDGIPFLRFTEEAQICFDEWRAPLEKAVRVNVLNPAFEAHLSKFRSLIPSLALIFHLVDAEPGHVGEKSILRAILWAKYLESHANRVYATGLDSGRMAALEIVRHIRDGNVKNPFTLRDIYRNGWRLLSSPDLADCAVAFLEDLGCVRPVVRNDTGGRPATTYFIHPALVKGTV